MNVLLSLPHLYTKFYSQIHLTLKVTQGDLPIWYALNARGYTVNYTTTS